MSTKIERRYSTQYAADARPSKTRAFKREDGRYVFSGYAFLWDAVSEDMGGFRECVRKGAATAALASPKNLFMILDHEMKVQNVLGNKNSGSLHVWEDAKGLAFMVTAADTTAASDAAKVVRAGYNIGVSFAFVCGQQKMSTDADGGKLREIIEFRELDDLCLVVDAAYKSSEVQVTEMASTDDGQRSGRSVTALRRELEASERSFQLRANPHHDVDGKFHDGSPERLLSAAAGRMAKAERAHATACQNREMTPQQRSEFRTAHAGAIEAAVDAIGSADDAYAAMVDEHRTAVDASRDLHAQLLDQGAGPPEPVAYPPVAYMSRPQQPGTESRSGAGADGDPNSPTAILASARSSLQAAEASHVAARSGSGCTIGEADRRAVAHHEAITAAEGAIGNADAAYRSLVAAHKRAVGVSQLSYQRLVDQTPLYASPATSATPTASSSTVRMSRPRSPDVEFLRRELAITEASWWTPPTLPAAPPTNRRYMHPMRQRMVDDAMVETICHPAFYA